MKKLLFLLLFPAGILIIKPAGVVNSEKQPSKSGDSVYVCMSGSAYAYHSGYCQGLKRCTHTVKKLKKQDATDQGFSKACGFCYR